MAFNVDLTNAERRKTWRRLMRELSAERVEIPVTKEELKAFVDAADTWATLNLNGIFADVPLPLRTALSGALKARIFLTVIESKIGGKE